MATKNTTKDLAAIGINARKSVHWNQSPTMLIEEALRRGEGMMTKEGAFVAITSPHTGRSPNDKFVVRESSSQGNVHWGPNQPLDEPHYETLKQDVLEYLGSQELFARDMFAGADTDYRLGVRLISTNAWHTLFAHNLFIDATPKELDNFEVGFTVLHAPEFHADPARHGTRTSTFIALNFDEKVVIIGGTRYAGEIKKSIFTVLNYMLPLSGVLSMHCSANVGNDGDVALFFGLSGTGKTTLSADPTRHLIGDDEHGWSKNGVFNFEGGNYAKAIRLSPKGEPLIFAASNRFGAVLENVVMNKETREVDWDSDKITENTRSAYPIDFIAGRVESGEAGHPRHVIFLTADAYGVLPPVARLTHDQARYHFLSGYTAKVAGTERGVTEPRATFSTCFGSPFLPLAPSVYSKMLGERLVEHDSFCWLINTGWTGGPYGVGHRMNLGHTRAIVTAVLTGQLDAVETTKDPMFGLHVPTHVPGVPDAVLQPRQTWPDVKKYDEQAAKLGDMFRENFKKFEANVSEEVRKAGPVLGG